MKRRRCIAFFGIILLMSQTISAQNPIQPSSFWSKPAAELAEQIASALGPGQAHLTVRNLSSIPVGEIPAIRKLLTQELKSRGVLASGAESANSILVTLSEDILDGLWIAEIGEGNVSRVVITRVGLAHAISHRSGDDQPITLRVEHFWQETDVLPLNPFPLASPRESPILAFFDRQFLIALKADGVVLYLHTSGGWRFVQHFPFPERNVMSKDPRGVLIPNSGSEGFIAYISGAKCSIDRTEERKLAVNCAPSDDPWPIAQPAEENAAPIKAFYNAARNYFTGVITPSIGVDLPPFYSLAVLERPGGPALLINGIDGKVQLAANGALKPVSGARDWGSDFALLHSSCPSGDLVIASSSGEAQQDSLRAYRLPGLEAQPVSAPVAMNGTVTSMWQAEDGKSLYAVVRKADDWQEVVHVTALCN